jgi:hypothetical protein
MNKTHSSDAHVIHGSGGHYQARDGDKVQGNALWQALSFLATISITAARSHKYVSGRASCQWEASVSYIRCRSAEHSFGSTPAFCSAMEGCNFKSCCQLI